MNKVDVQLLGIGVNGHIAFNEPGSDINSRTRKVVLTESTRLRLKGGKSQKKICALTLGVKDILQSKKINRIQILMRLSAKASHPIQIRQAV